MRDIGFFHSMFYCPHKKAMAEQQGQWNNIPNALESAQMRDAISGLGTRTCVCIVVPGRLEMMELISGGRVRLSTRIWNCGSLEECSTDMIYLVESSLV